VGALPVTFTSPVAAKVTSNNKKLLLDICDSNIFQEVLIFGAYRAYLNFIKHNITKTHSVFKTYFLENESVQYQKLKVYYKTAIVAAANQEGHIIASYFGHNFF
jgi:hypothetical protein